MTKDEIEKLKNDAWENIAHQITERGSVCYTDAIEYVIDYLAQRGLLGGVPAWLPIETAPKDGTHVLLINGEKGGYGGYCGASQNAYNIGVGYFEQYKNGTHDWLAADCCDGVSTYFPIHWMPLPQPPKEQS